MARALSRIKGWLVPGGRVARVVRGGVFRGLALQLDLTQQTQLYVGLFEREVHHWLRRFSREVRTVVDVGADQGEYTLFALRRTPARRVFAFEPSDASLALLSTNLHLNGVAGDPRLEVVREFADATPGENRRTLDSLVPRVETPCLVKVDVDGGEAAVLRGSAALLALRDVSWIIETHSAELEAECVEILERAGYRTVVVPNAWWRRFVPELRPIPHNRWLVAFRAPGAG